MSTNIIKKPAGTLALLAGGSRTADFTERVRSNQQKLKSDLGSQCDVIVCGSGSSTGEELATVQDIAAASLENAVDAAGIGCILAVLLAYRCGARQSDAQELAQRCDGGIVRGRVNEFDGQGQSHNDSFVARDECICAYLQIMMQIVHHCDPYSALPGRRPASYNHFMITPKKTAIMTKSSRGVGTSIEFQLKKISTGFTLR
jgi:hypothetical protein